MDGPSSTYALGEHIREARIRLGVSATRLAQEIDHHVSTITMLERGQTRQPKPKLLEELAQSLGLDLAELYGLAGYRVPVRPLDTSGFLHVQHRDLPLQDIQRIAKLVDDEVAKTKDNMKN